MASLPFAWMPEPLPGRDCSCALLLRLKSVALLKLREREVRREQAEIEKLGEMVVSGAPSSPSRASRRQSKFGGFTTGRATADVLQELYKKARIREVEEAKRKEEVQREVDRLRLILASVPSEHIEVAIELGFDGLQDLIESVLGDGSWARIVNSVPDDWDEEEALNAIADLLRRPARSEHAWLLLETAEEQDYDYV